MSAGRLASALTAIALITSLACSRPEPEAEPQPGPRLEHPGLGIALASLPVPFQVESAAGETLVLSAPGPGAPGRAVIAAGPLQRGGINLVEVVKEKRAWFEAAAEGTYFGNRELMSPIGTAFSARGTYRGAEGTVEETWLFAVHPGANRVLTIQFTYPTGESEERVQQAMALLGEIEALQSAG